jgi:serine/threonine protein kinase
MAPDDHQDDRTQSFFALTKGTEVDHYRILGKIGSGGMGEGHLAHGTQLDRQVALKFLSSYLCQEGECRKRFKREAQTAARLNHPYIITVFEVSEHHGRPFFAMGHVEGRTLREYSEGKDLPIEQILELGIQICEGLQAAHGRGVTHRDIKPSNILFDSNGKAKILDFGLTIVQGSERLTNTGSIIGTVSYMSPEQAEGKKTDHKSDIFSLAVVIYEFVTGVNPFQRDSNSSTMYSIVHECPKPLTHFVPNDNSMLSLKLFSSLGSLRDHPRFQALLEKYDDNRSR